MQAVDGAYADATMRLVLFPTADPDADGIEAVEDAGSALMDGDTCTVIEAGETMAAPDAAGSCYELHTSGTSDDSEFTIDTTGVADSNG